MDEKTINQLVEESHKAKEFAYCEYSKLKGGAALLTKDGTVISGCNVENASFGMTICAERTAIVKAVSMGYREFKAIAVASNMADEIISPCGACRQVMLEFGDDWEVYMSRPDLTYVKSTTGELLPYSFRPKLLVEHVQKM